MFTGIITATSKVLAVAPMGTCLTVRCARPARWTLRLGQSISLDGVCSTITRVGKNFFDVVYMPETRLKTSVDQWQSGRLLNAERSLTLRDPLDGSIVLGHVDRTIAVRHIATEGDSWLVTFALPEALRPFIALHGSVVINGVSLTVARVAATTFAVALIPYTLTHTNLGQLHRGDTVNVEVDMLARYVVEAVNFQKSNAKKYAKKG